MRFLAFWGFFLLFVGLDKQESHEICEIMMELLFSFVDISSTELTLQSMIIYIFDGSVDYVFYLISGLLKIYILGPNVLKCVRLSG